MCRFEGRVCGGGRSETAAACGRQACSTHVGLVARLHGSAKHHAAALSTSRRSRLLSLLAHLLRLQPAPPQVPQEQLATAAAADLRLRLRLHLRLPPWRRCLPLLLGLLLGTPLGSLPCAARRLHLRLNFRLHLRHRLRLRLHLCLDLLAAVAPDPLAAVAAAAGWAGTAAAAAAAAALCPRVLWRALVAHYAQRQRRGGAGVGEPYGRHTRLAEQHGVGLEPVREARLVGGEERACGARAAQQAREGGSAARGTELVECLARRWAKAWLRMRVSVEVETGVGAKMTMSARWGSGWRVEGGS